MATYIPNATQTTEPVESRTVESAALEFRTLKTSINERLDAETDARVAGDDNLQTQAAVQDERIKAIEAALLTFGDGSGMPGTVYVQRLSGTGAQTVFTLNVSVPASALIDIFINGVYQNKDTFTISGTSLTFSEAPPAGTGNIEVMISITLANVETDASLVSFRATDSIAVVRTAQDKMRDVVNVKDFGAVGDGVADDTAAVQAALNVGGRVEFDGTSLVSSTLVVKSGTYLVGVNGGGVKLASLANVHLIQNANYDSGLDEDIVFDSLTLDGNVANQTNDGAYKHGIRLKNVSGLVIKGCTIRNVCTDCVNLISCENAQIINCVMHGAYNHAVTFQECHGLLGQGNVIYQCGSKTDATGYASSGHAFIGVNVACNNVRIVGNYVYDMGDSCLRNERAGQGWVIANNIVVNSGKDSIKVMGVVGSSTKPKANVISGNIVINAGNAGIVANGDGTIVTNNSIYGTGKNTAGAGVGKWFSSAPGIAVLDNSVDVVVTGNYVREAYAIGIFFEGGSRGVISSNQVTACGTNGIELVNHDGAAIEGNSVFNNGTLLTATHAGIRVQGTASNYSQHSIKNNRCYNTGATGQLWGIRLEGGANVSDSTVQFNQLWGNTNAAQLFSDWGGAGIVINQNSGYKTENRGVATIPAGSTSVTVLHGLSTTPDRSKFSITPLDDLGSATTRFFVGPPNSTQFLIGINAAASGDKSFAWQVLP